MIGYNRIEQNRRKHSYSVKLSFWFYKFVGGRGHVCIVIVMQNIFLTIGIVKVMKVSCL